MSRRDRLKGLFSDTAQELAAANFDVSARGPAGPVRSMALMNKAQQQEMGWEWLLTLWYICHCLEVPELKLVYMYMYQILSVFAKQYELVLSRIAHHQNYVCAQWSWM